MNTNPECPQCQEWIDLDFSGELLSADQAKMQAHLKSCAECQARLTDYLELKRGMNHLAITEIPSAKTSANILKAAAKKTEERRSLRLEGFWHWLLRPATIAFATLVLVAGVGILGRQELQKQRHLETSPPLQTPKVVPAHEGKVEVPAAAKKSAPVPMLAPTSNFLGGATATDSQAIDARSSTKFSAPAPIPAGKAMQAEMEPNIGRFQILLQSAKNKIQESNYQGALEDLLAAQKIQDNSEVQDLISLCRSHLRGDG